MRGRDDEAESRRGRISLAMTVRLLRTVGIEKIERCEKSSGRREGLATETRRSENRPESGFRTRRIRANLRAHDACVSGPGLRSWS